MADNKKFEPCTCAGMQIFSSPINTAALKKNATVVLPRDLPTDPTVAANKINGVRDDSLTQAQTATINVSLTKQKLDNLPDIVKTRPAVQQMSTQLTDMQTNLVTQTTQLNTLNTQLIDVEKERDSLFAEKNQLEQSIIKASIPASADLKNQISITDSPEYKSFEGYKSGVENLSGSLSPSVLQDELSKSQSYQSVLSDISALDTKQTELFGQYNIVRDGLKSLSASANAQLPDISNNIDLLQSQYNDLSLSPSKLAIQSLPQVLPKISTDATSILNIGLNTLDSNGQLSSLLQNFQSSLPALPPSFGTPGMPALPSMPAFPQPTFKDGLEFIKLPPGLLATPALPAMPAFPGTDALPALPETFIDKSIDTVMNATDTKILAQAKQYASTVKLSDIKAFFASDAKSHMDAAKSALKQTASGYLTQSLSATPAIPARPALPAFPATADLTSFAGLEIPTLPSLKQHIDKISPENLPLYNAIWTEIAAKQAARERVESAFKEQTATSQSAISQLADAQKQANLDRIPVAQYLEEKSGTNPIYQAIEAQKVPSLTAGFSSLPATPLQCTKQCQNFRQKKLFPDVNSSEQMKVATLFADADEFVSTPAVHMISVGNESDTYVQAHIANMQNRIQESGGKTTTVFSEDIKNAVNNPDDMLKLESSLQDTSMVFMPNVSELSPQEATLVNKIAKDMSTSVPVVMTTPSIGTLAAAGDSSPESLESARKMNTALIGQLAPGGSIDARKETEVPQKTIYDNPEDPVQESSEFQGLFRKYKS